MKAIYNDNLTIETRDDASKRNLRECWALQEVVEGKALVIGGGITPVKQNAPMYDGVSLWLAEDPTENAEIKLDIVPAMMDGFPIVKINCAPACPDDEEEAPSAPADGNADKLSSLQQLNLLMKKLNAPQSDPTTPDGRVELLHDDTEVRESLQGTELCWVEDENSSTNMYFAFPNHSVADQCLSVSAYIDEDGQPKVRFVLTNNAIKPQQ